MISREKMKRSRLQSRPLPRRSIFPLDARRAAGELAEAATAETTEFCSEDTPDVSGFWVQLASGRPDCVIVYVFGGGHVRGSPASCRKTAGHLALAANALVFVPNYKLAPSIAIRRHWTNAVAAYQLAARSAGTPS